MCGIVGYIGNKPASPILLDGLSRLEYRGYDSAGIAVLNHSLQILKSEGKLANLVEKAKGAKLEGTIGIGHTRWATHGGPTETNAHPHRAGRVVLIHNGIVENYTELKIQLKVKLKSQTDTEIISHLIDRELKKGMNFFEAIRHAISQIEGTYALVILDTDNPDELYVVKKASPLVIGFGEKEYFVASDIPALLPYTRKVVFLENFEMAVLAREGVRFYNKDKELIHKNPQEVTWTAEMAEKGGFKHFMLKEIFEQPRVIENTLATRLNKRDAEIYLDELRPLLRKKFPFFDRFYIVACGTSWHAALAGKYYIEAMAKIPVNVDTASEFRYREPFIDKRTLLLVISQSGETADTLACVEDARQRGATVLSICNVMGSSISRQSQATLYTYAGPEIGVASTKAFTTQLTVLLMLAIYFARQNHRIDKAYEMRAVQELSQLPQKMEEMLGFNEPIREIAKKYLECRDVYYIARGVHFPIALEGALKLKEISYIHAEGYSAGEMKHGPIALLEPGVPVVALAPQDRVCTKMISNIEEVRARGASVIAIGTEGDSRFKDKCDHFLGVPKTAWYITPILVTLPLQLLAYHLADLKGTDVDQPRNLAKSVTVE